MTKLDEKVFVPIGLAVLVIGGSAAWVTRVQIEQSAQAAAIKAIKDDSKDDVQAIRKSLEVIASELAGVKGELKRIPGGFYGPRINRSHSGSGD